VQLVKERPTSGHGTKAVGLRLSANSSEPLQRNMVRPLSTSQQHHYSTSQRRGSPQHHLTPTDNYWTAKQLMVTTGTDSQEQQQPWPAVAGGGGSGYKKKKGQQQQQRESGWEMQARPRQSHQPRRKRTGLDGSTAGDSTAGGTSYVGESERGRGFIPVKNDVDDFRNNPRNTWASNIIRSEDELDVGDSTTRLETTITSGRGGDPWNADDTWFSTTENDAYHGATTITTTSLGSVHHHIDLDAREREMIQQAQWKTTKHHQQHQNHSADHQGAQQGDNISTSLSSRDYDVLLMARSKTSRSGTPQQHREAEQDRTPRSSGGGGFFKFFGGVSTQRTKTPKAVVERSPDRVAHNCIASLS